MQEPCVRSLNECLDSVRHCFLEISFRPYLRSSVWKVNCSEQKFQEPVIRRTGPKPHRLNTCRLEWQDLLTLWVEIDAALLHVRNIAEVRGLGRAMTDLNVAIRQFPRLHAF